MKIQCGNFDYTLLCGYQKDNKYRLQFDKLANNVFGISFENWYKNGYWNEKYIPYTLFANDKAVANVSINIMNFNLLGKAQLYIQIGTVMTDSQYRNQGLNRFLMEKVINDWNDKCDFIYLFANKSVLNLYPKFGFTHVREYEYFKSFNKQTGKGNNKLRKLDMDIQSNKDTLYSFAKTSKNFSKLTMRNNADLVMFYCISFFKDNIYYIEASDTIIVASFSQDYIYLIDIFSNKNIELLDIIYSLTNQNIKTIKLGFTPIDCTSWEKQSIDGDDTLFIQSNKTILFSDICMMFPILSHA